MAEIRLTHLVIVGVPLAILGCLGLIFLGAFAVPSFNLFGWQTPEVSKKKIQGTMTQGSATALGYVPAKTPEDAMKKFQEAIAARRFNFAAIYCTKPYAEMLESSHENMNSMCTQLDNVRNWGDNKSLLSDKVILALYQLDPFPTHFRFGSVSKEANGKATGQFIWEPRPLKLRNNTTTILDDLKEFDPRMYNNTLAVGLNLAKVELLKEGEDWKINVPVTAQWKGEVEYCTDRAKVYAARLGTFYGDINRQRNEGPGTFQSEVFIVLRSAK